VAAIVPSRNRHASVTELVKALADAPPVEQIIVVDEASDPPLKLDNNPVLVVRNSRPQFLAAARNRGASLATTDVLLFVDDDCLLDRRAPELLCRELVRDRSVGIAGPVIAFLNDPQRIWTAGNERSKWSGRTRQRAYGKHVSAARQLRRDCTAFPSVLAIRRDLFETVGGFDERTFPYYMTEDDLAERLRSAGYRVVLVPDAVAWHDISPTAPLSRLLHMQKTMHFFVARDRVRFILREDVPPLRRISHVAFWCLVLVPVYLASVLLDRTNDGFRDRLFAIGAFLEGNRQALMELRRREQDDSKCA
jgi:GT2 family glycosyltransferase